MAEEQPPKKRARKLEGEGLEGADGVPNDGFAVVRRYTLTEKGQEPGRYEKMVEETAGSELVKTFKSHHLREYFFVRTSDKTFLSASLYDTKEESDLSNKETATWIAADGSHSKDLIDKRISHEEGSATFLYDAHTKTDSKASVDGYSSVRRYTLTEEGIKNYAEMIKKTQQHVLGKFLDHGLKEYCLVHVGKDKLISISLYETEKQALQSQSEISDAIKTIFAEYIKETLSFEEGPATCIWDEHQGASADKKAVPKVVITYCGSCGYGSRFRALKNDLEGAIPGILVEGVVTPGLSGAFEVQVDGGQLVHSKLKGDGHVPRAGAERQALINKIMGFFHS